MVNSNSWVSRNEGTGNWVHLHGRFASVAIIPIAGSVVSLFIYMELFEHCLLRFVTTADSNFHVEELQFQEVCCSDWLVTCESFTRVPPNNGVRFFDFLSKRSRLGFHSVDRASFFLFFMKWLFVSRSDYFLRAKAVSSSRFSFAAWYCL